MATLENYLEDVAIRLYEGFKFPKPDEQRTTEEIIQAFDEFAIGESNETFECNKFKSRKQEEEAKVLTTSTPPGGCFPRRAIV